MRARIGEFRVLRKGNIVNILRCALPVLVIAAATIAQPQYSVVVLEPNDARYVLEGVAINDSGQVAGYRTLDSNPSAMFFWDGQMIHDLPLGFYGGLVNDLNNDAWIVGTSRGVSDSQSGFRWREGAGFDHPADGDCGRQGSSAYSTNNVGQIVGSTDREQPDSTCKRVGYLWQNGQSTILAPFHSVIPHPRRLNDLGHEAGLFVDSDNQVRYFFLNDQGYVEIEVPANYRYFTMNALNDLDEVVGSVFDGKRVLPYRWSPSAGFEILPTPAEAQRTYVGGSNDNGDIVGWIDSYAAIWIQDQYYDLNDLIQAGSGLDTLIRATGINEHGQICGTGSIDGQNWTFILTPVCTADFNDDGIVNTLDFIAFLNAYNEDDPRADINGDGIVNTLDFIAFLNAYNGGCG